MKRIALLLLVLALMAACFGCASETPEDTTQTQTKPQTQATESTGTPVYTVSMKDSSWLVEPLRSFYKPGEKVIVKVRPVTDANVTMLVNGKTLKPVSSGLTCFQFEFTMPSEDVYLEVKSEDASDLNDWGSLF